MPMSRRRVVAKRNRTRNKNVIFPDARTQIISWAKRYGFTVSEFSVNERREICKGRLMKISKRPYVIVGIFNCRTHGDWKYYIFHLNHRIQENALRILGEPSAVARLDEGGEASPRFILTLECSPSSEKMKIFWSYLSHQGSH